MRLQRINEVATDGIFVDLDRECLFVTRLFPDICMRLVLRCTEVNGVSVVVHRVHDQMQGIDVRTMFA